MVNKKSLDWNLGFYIIDEDFYLVFILKKNCDWGVYYCKLKNILIIR